MKLLTQLETGFELHLNQDNEPSNEKFSSLVLDAVDSTLSSLGAASKKAFYNYLEKSFVMNREDIPSHIADFAEALESIFGQAAIIIEARIMRMLHDEVKAFKYFPGQSDLSFVSYVEGLRAFL